MPHNQVLIPLDGSAFSERILPVVRRYLPPTENELILFQVVEPPDGGSGGLAELVADEVLHDRVVSRLSPAEVTLAMHPIYASQIEDTVVVNQEVALQPIVHELTAAGYTVSTEIAFGDPAPAIEQVMRQRHIDLVAMTTHGRTGLSRALLGSVAEHVLRHVAIPILLLHPFERGSSV
jgi:nucleotide-binding universal stress UspA family protein